MESCLSLCSPKAEPESRAWVLSLRGKEVQEAGGGEQGAGEGGRATYGVLRSWMLPLGSGAASCKTPSEELCVRELFLVGMGGVTFVSHLLPLLPPSEGYLGV